MLRRRIVPVVLAGTLAASAAPARTDELDEHLAELRPQLEDRRLPIADRERLALELAANLDGAAREAPTAAIRRSRWAEAADLLDEFQARNPIHPRAATFALQAAVYRWAEAQVHLREHDANPADPKPQARALAALDGAIAHLRPLLRDRTRAATDPLAQNARYRLARALADRATIDPNATGSRALRQDALAVLDGPITEPSLAGFTHLLRADLLISLGHPERAEPELAAAAKSDPPPSVQESLETQVALMLALKRYDEAIRAVDGSTLAASARGLLAVRILLARRDDIPAGPARSVTESELFERLEALRRSAQFEARVALAAVARAFAEPDPQLGPGPREALAEGAAILGRPDRAGALAAEAAEQAAALGDRERAATLRYRAAALLYQADKLPAADALLTRILDDPKAGPLRPRAGLLRILARGRIAETSATDDASETYLAALEGQVRDFPNASETQEARWRLGRARLAAGDRERAVALWSAIPHGSPRWLDARLAALDLLESDLDAQLLGGDLHDARGAMDEAQGALDRALAEAGDAPERPVLEWRRARLDLVPEIGHPDAALAACDRLLRSAGRDDLRDRARRLRIAALARLGRTVDAEREARAEARRAGAAELLDLARVIDRAAAATESDLLRRRAGALLRILLAPLSARSAELPPSLRAEAALRRARAQYFSGDLDSARATLADAAIDPRGLDDRQLDDLADASTRLDDPTRAIDAYRLLARRRRPGSIPWFAARYAQALAYTQSGRLRDARQLIDGTAILHPDLGGGELRNKFERLRQRLAQE